MLDIVEARELVPNENATTVQVACSVVSAVVCAMKSPNQGVCLPDDLNHEDFMPRVLPYLGPFVSAKVEWHPYGLMNTVHNAQKKHVFPASFKGNTLEEFVFDPTDATAWQFTDFQVAPLPL